MSHKEKIQNIINESSGQFFERDLIIRAAWLSILSKQHMLLLGVPGTAKSDVIKLICKSIFGVFYFKKLLTRFSVPEELFGPFSLKKIEEDVFERVITRMLPTAHIAFIDEIFKSSPSILNTLLTLINEREFDNGPDTIKCPLISMFGASNELPQEEELRALYDRFLFRFNVPYINDNATWEKYMLAMSKPNSKHISTTIDLDQLVEAQAEVSGVELPIHIISKINNIKKMLEHEGIICSDRRWGQTISVLKADAWLSGQTEISEYNLRLLCDMMWETPEQRNTLVSVVLSVTNPLDLEAIKILDDITDVYTRWDKKNNCDEVSKKIRAALEKLKENIAIGDPAKLSKTREVFESLSKWYKEVLKVMDI